LVRHLLTLDAGFFVNSPGKLIERAGDTLAPRRLDPAIGGSAAISFAGRSFSSSLSARGLPPLVGAPLLLLPAKPAALSAAGV
jgi:hypothetical protein